MKTATKKKEITFEEFCYLVKEGQKADLIDGVIYMASPDNTDANYIEDWLIHVLGGYIAWKGLGRLMHSRVAFRLNQVNAPEPDLGFVSKERLGNIERGRVEGPPDVAIEIVSPESVDRDYRKKRLQYQEFGVKEYWIVDEVDEIVTWYRLGPKGKYREVRPRKGVLRSEAIPGFWLRPDWLWQKPLPVFFATLKEILPEFPLTLD
jgi:Uma2 family endonuclease